MLSRLVALFVLCLPAVAAQTQTVSNPNATVQPKQETCVVSGMVVRRDDSAPLKNAIVQLATPEDRQHTIATKTGVDGRFELRNVPAGQYHLSVSRNGYFPVEYGQMKPSDPGATFTLRPGQKVSDLLFKLGRAGVITGHVFDEEGEPMPNVQVWAMRTGYENGHKELRPQMSSQSNDLGEFRVFGLAPGRYYLSAETERWNRIVGEREFTAEDKNSAEKGYVKTYYPSATDPSRASIIGVKEGEEIPSIDFLMKQVSVYRIRGKVVSQIPKVNVRTAWVQVLNRNQQPYWMSVSFDNRVRPDGSFEISELCPGEYTAIAQLFDEGKSYRAQQDVDVTASDIEGLILTIGPGTTILGRILWDGPSAFLPSEQPRIQLTPEALKIWMGSGSLIDENNQFTLKEVSDGTYGVGVWGFSKDCYIKAVRYGDTTLPDTELRVFKGSGASLDVTISSRGAHVVGTVLNDDNLSTAGVWVVAVPEGSKRNIERLYKAERTDQNGQFDLRGLAPGHYKLFSWDSVEEGAWQDPDFLKEFEGKGETLEVQDGDSKQAGLKLLHSTEGSKPN